jgi:hypothetical protein
MDHETAVRTSATERYFLGELTGQDQDGFEEHYFMCPECAEDVRALTVFAANAKAVFRQKAAGPTPQAAIQRELAEARAPQFVQDVPVLGVSRGPGTAREISSSTPRIVFYLTQPFRNIGYEVKDESGAVRSRQILPAPPEEDSAEWRLSLSTADLKPGAYEIRFWGVGEGGESPIGLSKFKIAP